MADDVQRPNPDELLRQISEREHERSDERGYLKIFLGYVAGVGKTYRMLREAIMLRESGKDVIAGIVETHGREETEYLMLAVDALPRKKTVHGGITLEELDVDAILARRPAYVLVDELAHTNVPGSRHEKRYQDVEELLAAGLNVYTCVNVQHIESINDVVFQITGVRVRETVPDRIIAMADKIELVDLPADEMTQRLKEGKVYVPEKAKVAAMEFFKKANLLALRELALRYTARRVDDDIIAYRKETGITGVIPAGSKLLVCVSASPSSAELVRTTQRLADDLNATWQAVYVESTFGAGGNDRNRLQLDRNLALVEELGGTVVKLTGEKPSEEIVTYAKTQNVTLIIIGFSKRTGIDRLLRGSLIDEIVHTCDPIQVLVIPGKVDAPAEKRAVQRTLPPIRLRALAVSLGSVMLLTAAVFPVSRFFRIEPQDVLLLYVIPIIVSGIFGGIAGGVIASFAAVLCYNFFFIPPVFTFSVGDPRYLFTFIMLAFVGTVISVLAERVRRQTEAGRQRERILSSLYGFSRELLSADNFNELTGRITRVIAELFESDVHLLIPDSDGRLRDAGKSPQAPDFTEQETGIAQWVFEHEQKAGKGTKTLSSSKWLYLPLSLKQGNLGVLAVSSHSGTRSLEQDHVLASFTNVVALAIVNFYELVL